MLVKAYFKSCSLKINSKIVIQFTFPHLQFRALVCKVTCMYFTELLGFRTLSIIRILNN
jgi:hypothetical protein